MNQNDCQEKTEAPTHYKIQQAQQVGLTNYFTELIFFISLNTIIILMYLFKIHILSFFFKIMSSSLTFDRSIVHNNSCFLYYILSNLKIIFLFFFIFFIFILLYIYSIQCLFNGLIFKFSFIQFHTPTINFKNIFSDHFYLHIFIILIKLIIFFIMLLTYFLLYLYPIINLTTIYSFICLKLIIELLYRFWIFLLIGFMPIVIFDVWYKYFNYYKNLQMSRQELKDEYKYIEGNKNITVYIKNKYKIFHGTYKNCNISVSNIIITNITSCTISMQYNPKKIYESKILVKGFGQLSYKIQRMAKKYNILVLHNDTLTRKLYKYGIAGQCIPKKLYSVMSELKICIDTLKNKKMVKYFKK